MGGYEIDTQWMKVLLKNEWINVNMGKTSQSSQKNWKRPLNKDVMKNGDSGTNPGLGNFEIRDTDIQNVTFV